MIRSLTLKNRLALIIIIALAIILPFVLFLSSQRQDIRNRAAGSGEIDVILSPSSGDKTKGVAFDADIKMMPVLASASSILVNGAQAVVAVSDKLTINSATCLSPYNGIPFTNINGQTVTVMCSISIGTTAPDVSSLGRAFARLNLTPKDAESGAAPITFNSTRVTRAGVQNESPDVSTAGKTATYNIVSSVSFSPTPESGNDLSPTPGSGGGTIPPGNTPSITVPIGSVTGTVQDGTPYIYFGIHLKDHYNSPDIKIKLTVKDLVAQLTPAPSDITDSCQDSANGVYTYKDIILTADASKVYYPKADSSFMYQGASYQTSSNGWIPLIGTKVNNPYSIFVKGPKHRKMKMIANVTFTGTAPGEISQNYIWTADNLNLEPGDLPDPNVSGLQDCSVNSVDISLIEERLGSTSDADLSIADVNYDGVVNGSDISKVANTLSTKPDDDL